MSKAVVRGICCCCCLSLTVAVRFQADRTRQTMMSEFDAGARLREVLRSHGLQLRKIR